MSNFRRNIIVNNQEDNKLIYTECTNASSYIELPYNIKDFRFKVKFEFFGYSYKSNDTIISVGGGTANTVSNNATSSVYHKVKGLYYSTSTLLQHVTPDVFKTVEFGEIYEVELSYVNNIVTCYIDNEFIYSYSDSRYVIRPVYLFNSIQKNEGSYSRIYEAKIYTSNDDSSIVYDLIPYEDPITHYGGFKDKLTGNVYTASGLIIGAK